jgi:hypothetical protein
MVVCTSKLRIVLRTNCEFITGAGMRGEHRQHGSGPLNIEIEHAFELEEHKPSHAVQSVNSSANIIEN